MRYAAPKYFTNWNAKADEASKAERPSVAAATCSRVPVVMPIAETAPAARLGQRLGLTMYMRAGRGMASRTAAPAKKKRKEKWQISIATSRSPGGPGLVAAATAAAATAPS